MCLPACAIAMRFDVATYYLVWQCSPGATHCQRIDMRDMGVELEQNFNDKSFHLSYRMYRTSMKSYRGDGRCYCVSYQ